MSLHCVNPKSNAVKDLAEQLGLNPYIVAAKVAVWQDNNGLDKWPNKEDLIASDITIRESAESGLEGLKTSEEVKYPYEDMIEYQKANDNEVFFSLKASDILQSDRAKQVFDKGEKNKWDLNKILTELAIPKEQKQLLLDLCISDREQLIVELASKYGYSVEVNTAKQIERSPLSVVKTFNDKYIISDYSGRVINEGFLNKEFETEQEANRYLITIQPNTNYYANLTVPGGTNYTENEISTPLITPSIKGHAQFSTDNGIGWFRSDEQVSNNKGKIIYTTQGTGKSTLVKKEPEKYTDGDDLVYEYLKNKGISDSKTTSQNAGNKLKQYIDTLTEKEKNKVINELIALFNNEKTKGKVVLTSNRFARENADILDEIYLSEDSERMEQEFIKRGGNPANAKRVVEQKLQEQRDAFKERQTKTIENGEYISDKFKTATKTRRILEVQSDLFQKGRDKETLVSRNNILDVLELDENKDDPFAPIKITSTTDNKFLQLLNKDSNWVTFFIKSIIQDSAKKGYEKVLFPKGETAAKIEGHETIADEIENINEQIEQQQFDVDKFKQNRFKNPDSQGNYWGYKNGEGKAFNTLEEAESYTKKQLTALEEKKQEYKSQGIEKLKPIEAFYEIKVGNILEKIYGKDRVRVVTDEYGNQWREIDLQEIPSAEMILLQEVKSIQEFFGENIKILDKAVSNANMEYDLEDRYVSWDEYYKLYKNYNTYDKSRIEVYPSITRPSYKFSGGKEYLLRFKIKQSAIDEAVNSAKKSFESQNPKSDFQQSTSEVRNEIDKLLNDKLNKLLSELYPEINVEEVDSIELKDGGQARGLANISAKKILINTMLRHQDTLPHEYAHFYIKWFRNANIVKQGIKLFNAEESLVQAIGEQVVRQNGEAYNWWKKFVEWVKDLAKSKETRKMDRALRSITDSFLTRKMLSSEMSFYDESGNIGENTFAKNKVDIIDHQVASDQHKQVSALAETKRKLLDSLKNRLNDLEHLKNKDAYYNQKLKNLMSSIEVASEVSGIYSFLKDAYEDILNMNTKVQNIISNSKGDLDKIISDDKGLFVLNHSFVGFYIPTLRDLSLKLKHVVDFKSELSTEDFERAQDWIKDSMSALNEMHSFYEEVRKNNVKRILKEIAGDANYLFEDELIQSIFETEYNMDGLTKQLFSHASVGDDVVRAIGHSLRNMGNEIHEKNKEFGDRLLKKYKEFINKAGNGKYHKLYHYLYERLDNGDYTGNFISSRNRGKYEKDKEDFLRNLESEFNEKYDLNLQPYEKPIDLDQKREFQSKINKWLNEHTIRRYTKEYYDMFNDLLPETVEALDEIDSKIFNLTGKYHDKKGRIQKWKLSDKEYAEYKDLLKQKQNLASDYHTSTGIAKSGIDQLIAKDIQKLNEKKAKNLKYVTDQNKFDKAKSEMLKDLSDGKISQADYNRWFDREQDVVFTDEFYDLLEKASTKGKQSEKYNELVKERSLLLKLYRITGSYQMDTARVPSDVRDKLLELDKSIAEERAYIQSNEVTFSDIASIKQNDQYYKDYAFFKKMVTDARELSKVTNNEVPLKQAKETYNEWFYSAHYEFTKLDGTTEWRVASFYNEMMPIDFESKTKLGKYAQLRPSSEFSDLSKESNFYNPDFEEVSDEAEYGEIPNNSYKNKDFAKIKANKDLHEFYKELLSMMEESNNNFGFMSRKKSFKMPQVEGNFYERYMRNRNWLTGSVRGMVNSLKYNQADELEYGQEVDTIDYDKLLLEKKEDLKNGIITRKEYANWVEDNKKKKNRIKNLKRADKSRLKLVPTNFLKRLTDPNSISRDLLFNVIAYNKVAVAYSVKSDNVAKYDLILEQLADRTVMGEVAGGLTSNSYKTVSELIDKLVYNISQEEGHSIKKTSGVRKIIKGFISYFRYKSLSWNSIVLLLNSIEMGHFFWREANTAQYFNWSDMSFALKEHAYHLGRYMQRVGKVNKPDKLESMMHLCKLTHEDEYFGGFHKKRASIGLRRLNTNSILMAGYHQLDFSSKSTLMLAIMNGVRLTDTGEFINKSKYLAKYGNGNNKRAIAKFNSFKTSLWDALEVDKDGSISPKKQYADTLTPAVLSALVSKVSHLAQQVDGTISVDEQIGLQNTLLGKSMLTFRSWMPVGIQARTKMEGYNFATQEDEVGFNKYVAKSVFGFIKNMMMFRFSEAIDSLKPKTSAQRTAWRRQAFDIANPMLIGPIFIYMALSSALSGSDDDDDLISWYTIYLMRRAMMERLVWYNPTEIPNLIKQPFPSLSLYDDIIAFIKSVGVMFSEDESDIIGGKGPYRDMNKGEKAGLKLTPAKNVIEQANQKSLKDKYNFLNTQLYKQMPGFGDDDSEKETTTKKRKVDD